MAGQSFAEWSGSNQSVAPTTPTTSSTPAPKGQSFQQWSGGTPLPSSKPMVFGVGEGLSPEQQGMAQDVLSTEVIPVGQTIKAPFVQAGITVPSGIVEDITKSLVEFPEKSFRSLSYLAGLDKQTQDRRGKQTFQVPSYAEISSKTTGELIDEGVPPAAAVILSSAQTSGQFANDALMYLDPLAGEGGVLKSTVLDDALLKTKTTIRTPESTRFFNTNEVKDIWQTGKVLSEAEKNNILQVIGGDSAKIKEAIQNGISIKVPSSTIIKLEDKPYWAKIKGFFGVEPATTKFIRQDIGIPVQTVRGYLNEGAPVAPTIPEVAPLPEAPVSAPTPTPDGIPTAPTAAEALQAAEAKVAASPEYSTLYHGGEKIEKIDLGKSNFGKTFFMTDSPEYAAEYANKYKENGVINKIEIKKDAKLIDIKNAPKDVIDQIKKIAKGEATGRQIKITKPDGSIITIPEYKNIPESGFGNYSMKEIIDGAVRGKAHFAEAPGLVQIYKDLGYDGMVTYEDSGMRGKNIGIWNENVVKIPEKSTVSPELKTAPSPFAKSLEKTAIDAGITKGFSEVAGYTPSTLKEQSDLTNQVIESGAENIASILKGNQPLPLGLKGGPFTVGIETWLKTNPNEEIAYALANSPLTSGVSESASELGLMQERNPDSAVAKIGQIKKAREAKAGKIKTEKVRKAVSKLAEETKKVNLDKMDLDWNNFLNNELAC